MKARSRRSFFRKPKRELDNTRPLRGQVWTRSERALKAPDVHWARRVTAALCAAAELALLVWLVTGPALQIRTVNVSGQQHVSAADIVRTAGLSGGGSVLAVDGEADARKLIGLNWVRAATVTPDLRGTVTIDVSEWEPVAAYHAGPSTRFFLLSDQAVVLGPAGTAGPLVVVQGPAGADPAPGDRPLEPVLLTALVNIQRGLPGLIAQSVASFVFDSCGNLTLIAVRGWKAYFGRVLTPEEFANLHDKLAALKSIAPDVDYNSADLDYVNVMNPASPAVKYRSAKAPAPPSPSPGVGPQPSPTASPSPVPVCR